MSNFIYKVKILRTGEIKEVYALDDYFGKHKYGYMDGEDNVYTEEEVEKLNK